MTLIRLQQAAFAAALAVQAGVVFSLAAEDGQNPASDSGPVEPVPFTSLFGTGPLFDFERSFSNPFSSFMNMFSPMHSLLPSAGTSLTLSLPTDEEDKRCYIDVKMGEGVQAEGVKIGLQTSGRRVLVSYSAQSLKEETDPQRGSSRSSSSLQVSSSLGLPERCMASPAVLLSSSGGYLLGSESGGESHARIVFPSKELLAEYIAGQKLPENVIDLLEAGDKQALDDLPDGQRCMAAGFTEDDCKKLGGKKPDVVSVASFEGPGNVVPIPRYDALLDTLTD